jgi:hypothetical protein
MSHSRITADDQPCAGHQRGELNQRCATRKDVVGWQASAQCDLFSHVPFGC